MIVFGFDELIPPTSSETPSLIPKKRKAKGTDIRGLHRKNYKVIVVLARLKFLELFENPINRSLIFRGSVSSELVYAYASRSAAGQFF